MRKKWLWCIGARVAAQRRSDGNIGISAKNNSRKYSELIKEETNETQVSIKEAGALAVGDLVELWQGKGVFHGRPCQRHDIKRRLAAMLDLILRSC